MKHRNVCYHKVVINTTLPSKAKCSVFLYSLFVHFMYKIDNKATFIVTEIINPSIRNIVRENPNTYIKYNIQTINTTSLSHSRNYEVKW